MTQKSNEQYDSNGASARSVSTVLEELSVDPKQGLTESTIKKRQSQYGLNRLEQKKQRSKWKILIAQFKSPIIGLLAVAAVLSFVFEEWIEGTAILVAILLNTAIGFITEVKAVQSMEALQQLSQTQAKVRRQEQVQEISAEKLVPGDIVLLEGGDLVAADLRLIEASKMQADESSLTGESVPVSKTVDTLSEDLSLAERTNMVYKGTAITRGSGEGVVVATGMNTELGHISAMTASAKEEVTPLEKRLDQLGRRLIWVTLAIAALVGVAGIIGGKDLFLMIETAIALAVAAVPEGLPIVATVALARGMWRMAKRNALINRLSAVETLGATSIICTDKTGTLTQNRMTVSQILLPSGQVNVTGEGLALAGEFKREEETLEPTEDEILHSLLEVGALCNNATLPEDEADNSIGDPMEVALLVVAAKADLKRPALLEDQSEVREVAFDSETKMMATFHQHSDGYRVAVKGAPESVLSACTHQLTTSGVEEMSSSQRKDWQQQCDQMAEEGLRILAFAEKTVDDSEVEAYEQLTFLGVVGLLDPPREEVKQAIQECHQAGIRVIMVTGDQPITARNVGHAVGLTKEQETEAKLGKTLKNPENISSQEKQQLQQVPIFARVSPEQKLNLIAVHQADGAVVAMTGDGVNDAPALKKADIGIAMGQRGTQVAQEAADMVLTDDAFPTILAAVEQGRSIFNNIRKFTLYLLSGNTGEIFAVAVASLMNAPLPLLPLQILFINAVNDVFPALALGVGAGNPQQMKHPPRDSKEAILTRSHWIAIIVYGAIIAGAVLGIFFVCLQVLGWQEQQAVTVSFLTIVFARLWHVFNMRDDDSHLFRNEVTQNPYIWGALLCCTVLSLIAVYIPGIAQILGVAPPSLEGWGYILGASLIPLIIGQIWKTIR
jgi:Ca2+-transporting ATPase